MKRMMVVGLVLTAWPHGASAQVAGSIGLAGRMSNLEAGGEIDARLRLPDGGQLGLSVRSARSWRTFVGGYAERDGAVLDGTVHGLALLVDEPGYSVGLRVAAGVRQHWVDQPQGPYDSGTRTTTDIGPVVGLHIDPAVTLRLGWTNTLELEVEPTTDVAALGQRLTIGSLFRLPEGLVLFAELGVIGTFGFGGDNEKFLIDGALGVRWAFGEGASQWRMF